MRPEPGNRTLGLAPQMADWGSGYRVRIRGYGQQCRVGGPFPRRSRIGSDSGFGRAGFCLGVVSLLQEDQRGNARLRELREQERVAVIYEQDGDNFVPQERDIYRLVNFLIILRYRASRREGLVVINFVE